MAEQETVLQKNLRARGEALKADLESRRKDLANLTDAVASAKKAGIEDPALTRLLDAASASINTLLDALKPPPPEKPTK